MFLIYSGYDLLPTFHNVVLLRGGALKSKSTGPGLCGFVPYFLLIHANCVVIYFGKAEIYFTFNRKVHTAIVSTKLCFVFIICLCNSVLDLVLILTIVFLDGAGE